MAIRLHGLAQRAEEAASLDGPAERVARAVTRIVPPGAVKDTLSGTWLGHPLHPVLTDLPIGLWMSAVVLDLAGGERGRGGAETLTGAGILAALPTALAGASDLADTAGAPRRVGVVHAAMNSAALAAFTASWAARRRGRYGAGVAFGLAGSAALAAGGFLGGHLVYGQGVGVDQTVYEPLPEEWTPLATEDDLEDGRPVKADVAGTDAVVVRRGGRISALANRCNHRGGPLDEGQLDGDCIVCPWHASVFRLDDGEVVAGPAAARQPALEVRVAGGKVDARARRRG